MITSTKEQLIIHDFNLPNHENELKEIKVSINLIEYQIDLMYTNDSIDDKIHFYYYEELIRLLAYLGKLSIPASLINEELEKMYLRKYSKSPHLAKKLWLNHYGNIHRPYNALKNKCFKMLDELDNLYIIKYSKTPLNWEY